MSQDTERSDLSDDELDEEEDLPDPEAVPLVDAKVAAPVDAAAALDVLGDDVTEETAADRSAK